MTLKEALESGKPFRRGGRLDVSTWYGYRSPDVDIEGARWTVAEVLATDWEVKREPREWRTTMYTHENSDALPHSMFECKGAFTCKAIRVRIVEEL